MSSLFFKAKTEAIHYNTGLKFFFLHIRIQILLLKFTMEVQKL